MSDEYTVHLFEYQYQGRTWALDIPAKSHEEARERLRNAASWGKHVGTAAIEIRLPPGRLVRALLGAFMLGAVVGAIGIVWWAIQ